MGPILAAIAGSLISKMMGGNQEQKPTFTPGFGPGKPKLAMPPVENFALRGMQPQHIPLIQENPILNAYMGMGPASNNGTAPAAPKESGTDKFNFKDAFLQSLTQNLMQRVVFGGQQPSYQYSPPTFGR